MKWVVIALASIVGLFGLTYLIGLFLPKDHVASVRARFKASAQSVWQIAADFAAWPSWNPSATQIERVADREGHSVWVVIGKNGRLPTEIVESSAPDETRAGRLVTSIADPSLPFGGSWIMSFEPAADGCTLTITENGEVRNPFFRFMSRFVFGHTGGLESFVKALGTKFGEQITPTVLR
jgi:hypothetical protein